MIKISSSILPDIYPVLTYQDKVYLDCRIVKDGFSSQIFQTEDKHQTVSDSFELERNVQSIIYDKYKFEFYAKENNSIELLQYADLVTIEDLDTGAVHQARILDLSGNNVSEMQLKKYVITYLDIYPANYKNFLQPKNNFLERENLLNQYTTAQLVQLALFGARYTPIQHGSINETGAAPVYRFYTALLPKQRVTETRQAATEIQGVKNVIQGINQTGYDMTFYCKEDEMNVMSKYLPIINNLSSSIGYRGYVVINGVTKQVIEAVTPEIKKIGGAIDLYECKLLAKVSNLVVNVYS